MTTFLSGPAAVFGVPGKAAAELAVEEINAKGGIDGVKLKLDIIDEGVGGAKLLSEYRRVVQEGGVKVMLASISSGNCNALAPVAEDLKVLNVMWDCGTEKILEDKRYQYVVRTQANATSRDGRHRAARAAHQARLQDLGRDQPGLCVGPRFVGDLHQHVARIQARREGGGRVVPQIRLDRFFFRDQPLQALSPDVILSTSWGGELDTLIRQAAQRGLMSKTTWVMPLAESSLERVGKSMPDGVIVGMRGDHYFGHPEYKDDPKHKAFVARFREKTGQYPIYSVYHAYAAITAVHDAYLAAIKANDGKWPSIEQVADAMRKLEFRGLTRPVKMREDGQGMEAQLLGVTKMTPELPFPAIVNISIYPAELVQNPGRHQRHRMGQDDQARGAEGPRHQVVLSGLP